MTAVQAAYLSWLMARHAEASRRLGSAYSNTIDARAADFCAVSRELVALRREIQATERREAKAA